MPIEENYPHDDATQGALHKERAVPSEKLPPQPTGPLAIGGPHPQKIHADEVDLMKEGGIRFGTAGFVGAPTDGSPIGPKPETNVHFTEVSDTEVAGPFGVGGGFKTPDAEPARLSDAADRVEQYKADKEAQMTGVTVTELPEDEPVNPQTLLGNLVQEHNEDTFVEEPFTPGAVEIPDDQIEGDGTHIFADAIAQAFGGHAAMIELTPDMTEAGLAEALAKALGLNEPELHDDGHDGKLRGAHEEVVEDIWPSLGRENNSPIVAFMRMSGIENENLAMDLMHPFVVGVAEDIVSGRQGLLEAIGEMYLDGIAFGMACERIRHDAPEVELTPANDRGFLQSEETLTDYGSTVRFRQSSSAEAPKIWMYTEQPPAPYPGALVQELGAVHTHMTLEQAEEIHAKLGAHIAQARSDWGV